MKSRDGVMRDTEAGSIPQTDVDEAPEPLAWTRTQVRRQNRCFIVAMAVFLITAAVYVIGGLDMSQENSLIEKYDAQSGVVEDGFNNSKATEAYEKVAQQASGTSGHKTPDKNGLWQGRGRPNPFGNNNAPKQGVEQSILSRHNSTTSTQPEIVSAKCEESLSRWNDWLDKKITKEDGKQYTVLEQLDHDSKAFTYVY